MTTSSPLDATLAWLDLAKRGWGLVVVPPHQQREMAEALAARVPGRSLFALDAALVDSEDGGLLDGAIANGGGFLYVDPDAGIDAEVATWRALNGRRDWLSDSAVWVIVLSSRQLVRLGTHAGDLASVARHSETVPFIPRELSDDEMAAARAELHTHYLRRFGRLDLRGFIRSEREDVSFPVEEIYQPLRGVVEPLYAILPSEITASGTPGGQALPVVELLTARRREDRRVPSLASATPSPTLLVGGPGSGKSFFLRHCALAASEGDQFAGQERPLPVYVPLAATRAAAPLAALEDRAFDDLLEAGLRVAHAFAREAEAGRVLFLLDGLDEVGDARVHVARQVAALAERYPRCTVVTTSRPTGLSAVLEASDLSCVQIDLAPLDDDALTALLGSWCELYEIERAGTDLAARGRAEGEQLARDVIASNSIGELARTPLLATIVAIVHRAGVRLPEHRVELYEHMTRVLVERWNQLRSQQVDAPPPVRVADAIRLLGPVAHQLVARGIDAAVDEDALRALLAKQLALGTVRSLRSVDEAITTFRDSLGLLVEVGPGLFGFLHKTLGEFLAAHELARTDELERLIETGDAFAPRWREMNLLALGLIGSVQVNDLRLARCIAAMVESARGRRATRDENVPALLGGVLIDDPELTPSLAQQLIDELVPAWWFDSLLESNALLEQALHARHRWSPPLRTALDKNYANGIRIPITSLDDALRVGAAYFSLAAPSPIPSGRLLCEFATRWATTSWPVNVGQLVGFYGVSVVAEEISVPDHFDEATLLARLAIAGGCQVLVLSSDAGNGNLRFQLVKPRRFRISHSTAPNESPIFNLMPLPPKERAAALPAILDLWREIAAEDPDGPAPPASVEEAYAIYGPRPRDP